MSGKELPGLDASCKNVYPELLPRQPLLSSGKTLWSGISLDQLLLPLGETPEFALLEFVLTINLCQGFQVERAKELLLQGKLSISHIAIACGFTHQSHLNRHFKRLTGVTPKTLLNL